MAMERTQDNPKRRCRREWLRSAGRAGCLAALAGLGGWLGGRRLSGGGQADAGAADCQASHPCAACGLAGRCSLPRALAARKEVRP